MNENAYKLILPFCSAFFVLFSMDISSTVGITRNEHKRSTTIVGYSICIDLGVGGGSSRLVQRATKATKPTVKSCYRRPAAVDCSTGSCISFGYQTDAINTSFAFVLLSQIHSPVLGARLHHHHHDLDDHAAAGQTIILRWSPIRLSKLHLHCNGRPIKYETSLGPFIKSSNNNEKTRAVPQQQVASHHRISNSRSSSARRATSSSAS